MTTRRGRPAKGPQPPSAVELRREDAASVTRPFVTVAPATEELAYTVRAIAGRQLQLLAQAEPSADSVLAIARALKDITTTLAQLKTLEETTTDLSSLTSEELVAMLDETKSREAAMASRLTRKLTGGTNHD